MIDIQIPETKEDLTIWLLTNDVSGAVGDGTLYDWIRSQVMASLHKLIHETPESITWEFSDSSMEIVVFVSDIKWATIHRNALLSDLVCIKCKERESEWTD